MPMIIGLVIGFLVLGPIGALIGVVMGGFIMNKPRPFPTGDFPEGHAKECGCKKCYQARGLV